METVPPPWMDTSHLDEILEGLHKNFTDAVVALEKIRNYFGKLRKKIHHPLLLIESFFSPYVIVMSFLRG